MTGSLLQKSELVDHACITELSGFLPRRQQHADWKLSYSTYEHGMSLSALYRKMKGPVKMHNGPPTAYMRLREALVAPFSYPGTWKMVGGEGRRASE